jgi:hypothetical protein
VSFTSFSLISNNQSMASSTFENSVDQVSDQGLRKVLYQKVSSLVLSYRIPRLHSDRCYLPRRLGHSKTGYSVHLFLSPSRCQEEGNKLLTPLIPLRFNTLSTPSPWTHPPLSFAPSQPQEEGKSSLPHERGF